MKCEKCGAEINTLNIMKVIAPLVEREVFFRGI